MSISDVILSIFKPTQELKTASIKQVKAREKAGNIPEETLEIWRFLDEQTKLLKKPKPHYVPMSEAAIARFVIAARPTELYMTSTTTWIKV